MLLRVGIGVEMFERSAYMRFRRNEVRFTMAYIYVVLWLTSADEYSARPTLV